MREATINVFFKIPDEDHSVSNRELEILVLGINPENETVWFSFMWMNSMLKNIILQFST